MARGYFLSDRLEYRAALVSGLRENGNRNAFRKVGRLQYNFFDKEVYNFPSYAGSNFGAKKIVALGAAVDSQVDYNGLTANGRLVGVVTDRMLKDYAPGKATTLDTWEVHYLLAKTSVGTAMNPNPHVVGPDALLTDAALVIRDKKLYGLCVVDDKGDLIGVLTIKDLIEALFHLSAVALRQEPESPPA